MTKEYGNMFSLDQAIAEWRRQMIDGGINSSAALNELESHLREDVEQQTRSGTDAARAFANAVKRIGPPAALKVEFKKVEGNIPHWERMLFGYYCVWFPVFYLCLASYGLFKIKVEMTFAQRAWGLAAIVVSSALLRCTPYYYRFLPAISDRRLRQAIQIGCIVLWIAGGAVFANLILPQLNLTVGQIVVFFLWLVTPITALSGISVGLGDAAQRRIMKAPN